LTALKAHQVARFLDKPDLTAGIYLAYGTDAGLVRECGQRLLRYHAGEHPDPMAIVSLDASELDADPSRLATEARTPPMFGGARIIRVRAASKSLAETIGELLADLPDAILIIEAAGNLTPSDKLRTIVEKSSGGRALPCYSDNGESLSALVRQTFSEAGIHADPDVVPTLVEMLGNDREITRGELEKLTLYAAESKTLTRQDVLSLCGDNAALAMDQVVDATATGHAEKLDNALSRATAAGIDAQRLLAAALNHFSMLRRWRAEMDAGKPARAVLEGARPRPHFSRTASLEQQLRLWTDEALANACYRLYGAIADTRHMGATAQSTAHRALLAVCLAGARR
jgi:DNA polymerase III subunit delta